MSQQESLVTKRNGDIEPFSVEKINKIISWATENISGVSVSDICMNAKLNISDKTSTINIHDILIESAANLISEDAINYSKVAAKLLNYKLRKMIWGGKNPPKLYDFIQKNIKLNVYNSNILDFYSVEEINKIDEFVFHSRDELFEYAGLRQLCDKYLVQNRDTNEIFETPQFAYILIAMHFFKNYKNNRLKFVKNAYNAYSKFKINLPSPTMAAIRTNEESGASCCLMRMNDDLNSIGKTNFYAMMATSAKYGIGVDMSNIRAINSPVRNGETIHTGVIPFLKALESSIKCCKQGGARRGAGTVTFPIFHYEIESIIELKDNTGTEDNRVRHLDYAITFSQLFWQRFLDEQNITLFSYHEVPQVFDSFGTKDFDRIYEDAENSNEVTFKKSISAQKLFSAFFKQRIQTSRYYPLNIDIINKYTPWWGRITMSNLCVEVLHLMDCIGSPNEEIGVCILAATNMSKIQDDADHEKMCDLAVRMLDELIDTQSYFSPLAEKFAKEKRSIAVGVINLADWLARKGLSYEDAEAPIEISKFFEKQQYFLLKASCNLAKEKGPFKYSHLSKYTQGFLPHKHYQKQIDEFAYHDLQMDWDTLEKDIKTFGLRHSTVSAIMPCEASARISGSTNGIEPPLSPISYIKSKGHTLPCIVPSYHLKNKYTYAYEMENNLGYLKCAAAIQRWICMGMSTNVYYSYKKFDNGKIPIDLVIKEHLYATKWGIKTFYYLNTDDDDKQILESGVSPSENNNKQVLESDKSSSCDSGACSI